MAQSIVSEEKETEYQRDVRNLVDFLSKLNPSAKEFFPSSASGRKLADAPIFNAPIDYCNIQNWYISGNSIDPNSDGYSHYQQPNGRRRNGYSQWKRRTFDWVKRAEMKESVRRTIYVSDIDSTVTEEFLAEQFAPCGQVVDCRVCGDPHSVLRFAFIEFADEESAREALKLGGIILGFYPVKVLPSKTAILPVNPSFLPQSNDEREMVVRTVYCTNIDKKVTQSDVKHFFEQACYGEVSRLRLLGDNLHSTRIAFVEFYQAESAILALNCNGMFLGSLPIRVSPSKTPVRPRLPRAASN